jgi:hypothetical protein
MLRRSRAAPAASDGPRIVDLIKAGRHQGGRPSFSDLPRRGPPRAAAEARELRGSGPREGAESGQGLYSGDELSGTWAVRVRFAYSNGSESEL